MPIQRTEDDQPPPRDAAEGNAENKLHQPDPDDTNPAGDQDIDTAGTDAMSKARPRQWVRGLLALHPEVELMANQDPKPDRQDLNVEEPGDTDSADIVDRTGEQMPRQSHDGLETDDHERVREDDVDATGEGRQ